MVKGRLEADFFSVIKAAELNFKKQAVKWLDSWTYLHKPDKFLTMSSRSEVARTVLVVR